MKGMEFAQVASIILTVFAIPQIIFNDRLGDIKRKLDDKLTKERTK